MNEVIFDGEPIPHVDYGSSSNDTYPSSSVQTEDSTVQQQESEHTDSQNGSPDLAHSDDTATLQQDSTSANSQSDSSASGSSQTDSPQPTHQEEDCKGDNQTLSTEASSSAMGSDPDLDDLRNKAIEDAIEKVPKGTTTTTHETPQYNRSKAVRDYVLARADGQCEGCEEPAPFTSKTGDPYLHAHHVHELSDGGSDTPDTVLALCPNCHYRVHHGEDGDEYNQKLKRKLRKIEDDSTGK